MILHWDDYLQWHWQAVCFEDLCQQNCPLSLVKVLFKCLFLIVSWWINKCESGHIGTLKTPKALVKFFAKIRWHLSCSSVRQWQPWTTSWLRSPRPGSCPCFLKELLCLRSAGLEMVRGQIPTINSDAWDKIPTFPRKLRCSDHSLAASPLRILVNYTPEKTVWSQWGWGRC